MAKEKDKIEFAVAFREIFKTSLYAPPMAPRVFLHKVNKRLPEGHAPFTAKHLNLLLNGVCPKILSFDLAEAFSDCFAEYGDDFYTEQDASKLFEAASIELETQRRIQTNAWRTHNPAGFADKRSFAEMIEEVWEDRGRLSALFNLASEEWEQNKEPFAPEDMRRLMRRRVGDKKVPSFSIMNRTIFNSDQAVERQTIPYIHAIADSFKLEGQIAVKFANIARGMYMDFDRLAEDAERIRTTAGEDDVAKRHYLEGLFWNSGLSGNWIAELLSTPDQEIRPEAVKDWITKRSQPQKLILAKELAEILVLDDHDDDPARVAELRNNIVWMLTGQDIVEMDLNHIIENAKTDEDPRMALTNALFGRYSPTGKTRKDWLEAAELTEAQLSQRVTGKIGLNEDVAREAAALVDADEAQTEEIITVLTGIPNPAELIRQVKQGNISFADACLKMRTRKGLTAEQVGKGMGYGNSPCLKLEKGGHVSDIVAISHAEQFFSEEEQDTDEFYNHICYANGLAPLSPKQVLHLREAGDLPRLDAAKYIAAFSGELLFSFYEDRMAGRNMNHEEDLDAEPAGEEGTECFRDNPDQYFLVANAMTRQEIDALNTQMDEALNTPEDIDKKADILMDLRDATGLSFREIAELISAPDDTVHASTVANWITGEQKPGKKVYAKRLARVLIPDATDSQNAPSIRDLRRKMRSLVLGHKPQFNLDDIIARAEETEEPAKTLLNDLFGQNSKTGLSRSDLAEKTGLKTHNVSERVKGKVFMDESFALGAAALVDATEDQAAKMITIITGIPAPEALIKKVDAGEMTFKEAAEKMRMRKGWDKKYLATRMGSSLPPVQKLEKGEAVTQPYANLHANQFFTEDQRDTAAYYHHVCHALGLPPLSPAEIVEKREAGEMSRKDAVSQILIIRDDPKPIRGSKSDKTPVLSLSEEFRKASALRTADIEAIREKIDHALEEPENTERRRDALYGILEDAGLTPAQATAIINFSAEKQITASSVRNWLSGREKPGDLGYVTLLSEIMVPAPADHMAQPRVTDLRAKVRAMLSGAPPEAQKRADLPATKVVAATSPVRWDHYQQRPNAAGPDICKGL